MLKTHKNYLGIKFNTFHGICYDLSMKLNIRHCNLDDLEAVKTLYLKAFESGLLPSTFQFAITNINDIFTRIIKSGSGGGIVLEREGIIVAILVYLNYEGIFSGINTNSSISIVSMSPNKFDILKLIHYFKTYTHESGRVCELNLNKQLPNRISDLLNATQTGVILELK